MLGDLRYALRTLRRSPGFALASIAILALGIGANTAIFSVIHAVILKRLPYAQPEQLVFLWERYGNMTGLVGERIEVRRRNFLEWRRQNTVFSGMAGFREVSYTETGIATPARVSTGLASSDFFPMLGVRARLGRVFRPDEEQRGRDFVVVLSDRYFERRFGRDPSCIGKSIVLDGSGYTVIGVLPREFHLPSTRGGEDTLKPEVWAPLSRLWNKREDEERPQLLVMARLKPGASVVEARAQMAGIAENFSQTDPWTAKAWTVKVSTVAEEDTEPQAHRALWVLLAAVGIVVLIACANLANLTLARAVRRARDIAVRIAVGAGRRDVVRQLLMESLVLALAGGAAGLLFARWGIRTLLAYCPVEIPRREFIGLNVPVLLFTALVAILTALLFGLAPAVTVSRTDLLSALKVGGGWGGSASYHRKRQALIAAEVALALVLLAGAGFMLRSFHKILTFDLGFRTDQLLTLDVDLPEKLYKDRNARTLFNRRLLDRLQALPGVAVAAVTDNLPLHRVSCRDFRIAGRPEPKPGALPLMDFANHSPSYFTAMGLRLQAGRQFTEDDVALNAKEKGGVVVINESMARRYWPGENPIGQRILASDHAFEIVGIVADYYQLGAENERRPQAFFPAMEIASPIVAVRTHLNPASLAPAVQREIQAIDKDVHIDNVRPMKHYVDEWIAPHRFFGLLLGIFAALALTLAAAGIYSVLAQVISSRTHEIGIRLALGAQRGDVLALVFRQSMTPVALGAGLGLAGTFALSRYLESLLFGIHARDPVTITTTVAAIVAVAAAATWFPARRATRVDPGAALREE